MKALRVLLLAAFLGLTIVFWRSAFERDGVREEPPPLTAAFAPFRDEQLWSRADRLYGEGRLFETTAIFEEIAERHPRRPRVWMHLGYIMALNIAQNEVDDEARVAWYERAVAFLRRGAALNPSAFELREFLFRVFISKIAEDPFVDRRFREHSRFSGLEWAIKTAEDLRRDFPARSDAHAVYVEAGEAVVLRLLGEGRLDRALAALGELRDARRLRAEASGGEAIEADSTTVFLPVLEALVRADALGGAPSEAAAFAASLAATVRESGALRLFPGARTFDAGFLTVLQIAAMNRAQRALVALDADGVLPWLQAARAVTALEGRLGEGRPYYDKGYCDEFDLAVVLARSLAGDLAASRPTARENGAALDDRIRSLVRRLEARTGRADADGFVKLARRVPR